MAGKILLSVLLTILFLPQTQTPAIAMLTPDDKSIPRNGCVIYNPYNVTIIVSLRNKTNGAWDQQDEIRSGKTRTYIEKDYILFQNGSAAKRLDYKIKYVITWNGGRKEWDILPV